MSIKEGKSISEALDLITDACQTIRESGACGSCPLHETCLEENNFLDVAYFFVTSHWESFLGFADDVEGYMSDSDMEAYYADEARKGERDEYYE